MKSILSSVFIVILGFFIAVSPFADEHSSAMKRWEELRDSANESYRAEKMDEAIRFGEEALAFSIEELGYTHVTTGTSMFLLVGFYAGAERLDEEAVAMHKRLIELSGEVFGRDHGDTLLWKRSLASYYEKLGRMNEAYELEDEIREAEARSRQKRAK